jgi:hypothetical protein
LERLGYVIRINQAGVAHKVSESKPERRKVGKSILRWLENVDDSGVMEAKVKQ